jgi:hypothetical protein
MPIYDASASMIRAFQTGLAERQTEEDRKLEAEDRKLQQEVLAHQLKRMKLQEKLQMHEFNVKGAQERAKALSGMPEADLQALMPRNLPATGIGGIATPQAPPQPGAGLAQAVTPTIPGVTLNQPAVPPFAMQAVQGTMAPPDPRVITQPGFTDAESGYQAPAIPIPIRSKEELQGEREDALRREIALKDELEPKVLKGGDVVYKGGKAVFTAADPQQEETARHNREMEKIDRMRVAAQRDSDRSLATVAQKQAAEKWMFEALQTLEQNAAPDTEALAQFREDLDAFQAKTPQERAKSAEPKAPKRRMTDAQVEAEKLKIYNSYRSQINLPAASTLPPEWRGTGPAPTATPTTTPGQTPQPGVSPEAPAQAPQPGTPLATNDPFADWLFPLTAPAGGQGQYGVTDSLGRTYFFDNPAEAQQARAEMFQAFKTKDGGGFFRKENEWRTRKFGATVKKVANAATRAGSSRR